MTRSPQLVVKIAPANIVAMWLMLYTIAMQLRHVLRSQKQIDTGDISWNRFKLA